MSFAQITCLKIFLLCSWTLLGALPADPLLLSHSMLAMVCPSFQKSWVQPWLYIFVGFCMHWWIEIWVAALKSTLTRCRAGRCGTYTLWATKNVALYFCQYLCRLLINFHNSFTGTLCRQFAIMWLLYIPPHGKCISTLLCEIHNNNNKNLGK